MRFKTEHGFSLEVNPKSYLGQCLQETRTYEDAESRLILSLVHPGDFCIDAGAHVGYFSCLMAKAGARVLAIEPNPMHYGTLERNVAGLNVAVSHMALSDKNSDGPVPFYLPSEFDDGWGSLYGADKDDPSRMAEVWTDRLETILKIEELCVGRPDRIRLLKMDIEGSEAAALRGLGRRIDDIDYILVESVDMPKRIARGGSTTDAINAVIGSWNVSEFSGSWRRIPKSYVNGGNFLFTNPRIG